MKYLGLDLGTRSLGISISDLTKTVATPYEVVHFEEKDYGKAIEKLATIIEKEPIEKFILGYPKNMNGSEGPRAKETLEFKKLLEENFKLEVILQDERLSTKEASGYMIKADMSRKKRKQKIDSLAANIILQTYLDKRKGGKYGK
ncbi:MAG: Holliday junction resolvase RuvX [Bacilli bacterium]|nr:Holliday junction resolvase RuvX [Bacilli bacterium]